MHTEYWTETDQHRYEQRIAEEIRGLKGEVKSLSDRILLVMGGIALLAFLLPLIAPFVRGLFGL